ncbi:hypothetical protein C8Q76DRAFT_845178 [Earliella scabrosa]|nr:hypothetical protein C8Q76DRAFT_845178 [Earliella scabrosa]
MASQQGDGPGLPSGLFTSQVPHQCQNTRCRTPAGQNQGRIRYMGSAIPGTSGKYLCEACYSHYANKAVANGVGGIHATQQTRIMATDQQGNLRIAIGKSVAAAQRGYRVEGSTTARIVPVGHAGLLPAAATAVPGGPVMPLSNAMGIVPAMSGGVVPGPAQLHRSLLPPVYVPGLDGLLQLQQSHPIDRLPQYGYTEAHQWYGQIRQRLQQAAYAGGTASAELVTVKASMVTMKPGKPGVVRVGSLCESIASIPVHIGYAVLKYLVFGALYAPFLQTFRGFRGLRYDTCTLRSQHWVNIGEPIDPANDCDAIASECFVEAKTTKNSGPSRGKIFKPPKGGVTVYLEIPWSVYDEACNYEPTIVNIQDSEIPEVAKSNKLPEAVRDPDEGQENDGRHRGRLHRRLHNAPPVHDVLNVTTAITPSEHQLDEEPLKAVLGTASRRSSTGQHAQAADRKGRAPPRAKSRLRQILRQARREKQGGNIPLTSCASIQQNPENVSNKNTIIPTVDLRLIKRRKVVNTQTRSNPSQLRVETIATGNEIAQALSQQLRPSKPAAMAMLHSEDLQIVLQVCPQRTLAQLIESKPMVGAFKETRFALCTPAPAGFESGAVVIKQCFQKRPTAEDLVITDSAREILASTEQIQYLSQEIICLQWADALMKAVYDFIESKSGNGTIKLPFSIPSMRFVRAALALEADVSGPNRRVFMLEERIDPADKWRKYINNNSPIPLPSAMSTSQLQHIAEFLVFCQHYQYLVTDKSAFVSDFQGGTTLLSDPQIITRPTGNLGRAFEEFPDKHQCSKFCKYYELESIKTQQPISEVPRRGRKSLFLE